MVLDMLHAAGEWTAVGPQPSLSAIDTIHRHRAMFRVSRGERGDQLLLAYRRIGAETWSYDPAPSTSRAGGMGSEHLVPSAARTCNVWSWPHSAIRAAIRRKLLAFRGGKRTMINICPIYLTMISYSCMRWGKSRLTGDDLNGLVPSPTEQFEQGLFQAIANRYRPCALLNRKLQLVQVDNSTTCANRRMRQFMFQLWNCVR